MPYITHLQLEREKVDDTDSIISVNYHSQTLNVLFFSPSEDHIYLDFNCRIYRPKKKKKKNGENDEYILVPIVNKYRWRF